LAGYEDVNDAARLSQDPTFRLIGSRKIWERGAALTSRLQSCETEVLTQADNLAGLAALNRELVARSKLSIRLGASCWIWTAQRSRFTVSTSRVPTTDTSNPPAIIRCCCSIAKGDCLAAKLRPGNVHSAEGWEELLLPEIERQQRLSKEVVFRADAAFAKPDLYEALEERDVKYAIRLSANDNLQRNIPGVVDPASGTAEPPADGPIQEFSLSGSELQAASSRLTLMWSGPAWSPCSTFNKASGGTAVYQSGALDRCLRDVLTMNQHLMGSLRTYEMAGRLLLGLEPLRWLF
jgi:hypothetical protein